MKKFISAVVSAALCLSAATAVTSSAVSRGDCNNDGIIDATDATAILVFYAAASTGNATDWTVEQMVAADVNRDGFIDSSDASDVLGYYSHVSTGGFEGIDDFLLWEKGGEFKYVKPTVKVAEDGMSVLLCCDPADQSTGYDVDMVYYYYDEEKGSQTQQLIKGSCVKTGDVIKLSLPNLKLENLSSWYSGIELNIEPYKYYGSEKVTQYGSYDYISPYELLFPRAKGSSHNDMPVYDLRYNHKYWWTSYLTDRDRNILANFENEHFTPDMSDFQRLQYMEQWIYENFKYAQANSADWYEIESLSWVDATLVHKKGQCIQYDGALVAYMAYKGYKVEMVFNRDESTNWQHYWGVVDLGNGNTYKLDLGI